MKSEADATEDRALPPLDRLFAPLAEARGVLLAVSGGPDSVALMHLAAEWASTHAVPPIAVASVDHGFRAEARAQADTVIETAVSIGFAAQRLDWVGPKPEHAIQERAREARYELLVAHARQIGASHIVTAHTLDDQAETILFRLARGSGLSGLRGMSALRDRDGILHARPFLALPKALLVTTCHARGWRFIDDPANRDLAFARTRWRGLMPQLAAEGLTASRLAEFAARVDRADASLRQMAAAARTAAQISAHDGIRLSLPQVSPYGEDIVIRVLAAILAEMNSGSPIRLSRVESLASALLTQCKAGAAVARTLHGCRVALGRDGVVAITREGPRRRGLAQAIEKP